MDILIPIPGFHKYAVTRDGRVWSFMHRKFLKPRNNSHRYNHTQYVLRTNEGKSSHQLTHRIVFATYVLGYFPASTSLVLHKDGDDTNNDYTNLYLGNYTQNNQDTLRHNHRSSKQLSKISDQDVLDVMVDPRGSQTVAKQYGCSTAYIANLRRGVTRRHLTSYPQCPVPYLIPEQVLGGRRSSTNRTNSFGAQVVWDSPGTPSKGVF